MPTAFDIEATVFRGGSATLLARIVGAGGAPIAPGDLSAASYTVEQLNDADETAAAPVAGHEDVELAPSTVVFSTLQRDLLWTADALGYNFRHVLDVSQYEAFPTAGRRYRVTYRLTPSGGQVILVRFSLRAI